MIHVVFQAADVNALKSSFELEPQLAGDILEIKDDYAVGPLGDIYSEAGAEVRKNWWRLVLAGGDYDGHADGGTVNDQAVVSEIVRRLTEDESEVLWIWAAQNKHDVSGYYWLVSQLASFQGRVYILYLNNLPFINDKGGLFYPQNLFEIPAREFVKARKLARAITAGEFEIDPDEWKKLCGEQKNVRILEAGKKLVQHDDSFYDDALLTFISSDWIRTSKLIHTYLNKSGHRTGDAYLLWRVKSLVESGRLDAQGELKNMKDFEVKLAATQAGQND